MKAIAHDRYGPPEEVLALRDVDRPAAGERDVLVRVRASSVNAADWHLIRGEPRIARLQFGARRPQNPVPGCDVAGVVEQVGGAVTAFRVGDEVYGTPFMRGFGAFAELVRVPDDRVARKPANLSFEQAAAAPLAALTALQALRDHARVADGSRVLVVGASGGVGTFAVQIAKAHGAEVTGVCATRNVELVRSLGADHVLDHTRDDFADGTRRYDVILQAGGTRPARACRRALTPDGTLVAIAGESSDRWVGAMGRMVGAQLLGRVVSQRIVTFTVEPSRTDLEALTELIEAGRVTPAVDRTFPLAQTGEAIRYVESREGRAKVVVTV